jgi:hypothetical protein
MRTDRRAIILLVCDAAVVAAALNGCANDDLLVSVAAPLVDFAAFTLAVSAVDGLPAPVDAGRTALVRGAITFPIGAAVGLLGVWLGRRLGGGREPTTFD